VFGGVILVVIAAFIAVIFGIAAAIVWVIDRVRDIINWFKHLGENTKGVRKAIAEAWDGIVSFFTTIPSRITTALGDLGGLLVAAGRNLISGLMSGIRNMLTPTGLGSALGAVGQYIKDHFPQSPAKRGPLSGKGGMFYAGQNIVKQLQDGILSQQATLGVAVSAFAGNAGSSLIAPAAGSNSGGVSQTFNITTQEINPRKHAAELGFLLAGR
jgi:hypothetical protein